MSVSTREKRTVREMLHALSTTAVPSDKIRAAAAEVLGMSKTTATVQRFLSSSAPLPRPSQEDAAKFFLVNPELDMLWGMMCGGISKDEQARALAMVADLYGSSSAAESPPVEPQNQDETSPAVKTAAEKKKKKKSKKKGASGSSPLTSSSLPPPTQPTPTPQNVLRPRNFLEAALYFSSITLSTVEMAGELEPEHFFAPPLLFTGPDGTEDWLASLRKVNIGVVPFETLKFLQRRTLCVFAVALLQTAQHMKPSHAGHTLDHRQASIAVKSNYLKRTIGLYAISLVDHLPPSLTCRLSAAEKAIGPMTSLGHGHPLTQAQRLLFKNNPLLANRKLELNDLKVPSAQQISDYWKGLGTSEQISILRTELNALQKGWINVKKTWCLCKYCRTRSLRLGDVYELVYRAYMDDLERVAASLEPKRPSAVLPVDLNTMATSSNALKPKMRKLLFKSLSSLADDISNERSAYLVMVLKRLGKAFEEDYSEWKCENNVNVPGVCECCRNEPSPHPPKVTDHLPDVIEDYSDDEDEEHGHDEFSDSYEDEDLESFYEDFNMMEDEENIQGECELPIDPAHLSTTFPTLYDPRLHSLPRPGVPPTSDADRIAEGNILYEQLASLLFQFHLVPRYLEAEAIARQRKLLEEEEAKEQLEKERADTRAAARLRKKEKQKAAKKKQQEEANMVEETPKVNAEPFQDLDHAPLDPVIISEAVEQVVPDPIDMSMDKSNASDDLIDQAPPPGLTHSLPDEPSIVDDLPPGLSPHLGTPPLLSPASSGILTGEAPPDIPATWFDKILQGPLGDASLESLWSPLATSVRPSPPPPSEMPPGFGGQGWSPFFFS